MAPSRPGKRRPRVARCLLGAAGAVTASVAAHVSAGAALPSPALLLLLVGGLALLARLAPGWLRSGRVQLAIAALLQPLLHAAFTALPAADSTPGADDNGLVLMLLAHLVAALAATWWIARGAQRLVVSGETLIRSLRSRCSAVALPPMRRARVLAQPVVPGPLLQRSLVATPRRGPPPLTGPLPS